MSKDKLVALIYNLRMPLTTRPSYLGRVLVPSSTWYLLVFLPDRESYNLIITVSVFWQRRGNLWEPQTTQPPCAQLFNGAIRLHEDHFVAGASFEKGSAHQVGLLLLRKLDRLKKSSRPKKIGRLIKLTLCFGTEAQKVAQKVWKQFDMKSKHLDNSLKRGGLIAEGSKASLKDVN